MIKRLKITVEGKTYEVTVETTDEPAAPGLASATPSPAITSSASVAAPAASAPAPAAAAGAGVVPSPLAGKLVSYSVAVGQSVTVGQELAVIEAMKMNTYVNATAAGKVTALLATPGDGVEEGQGLIKIE